MPPYRLAITLGDPGGIGPEIVLKSLCNLMPLNFTPIIIGSQKILEHKSLKKWINKLPSKEGCLIYPTKPLKRSWKGGVCNWPEFIDINTKAKNLTIGKPNAHNGRLSYEYICKGIELIQNRSADALVTAPISKTSFQLAGIPYTGHTTLLADKTNTKDISMAFYTPKLKTVLTTIHIPYHEVPAKLTENKLNIAIKNSFLFAKLIGVSKPKIALAGLNPHAGEEGLLGSEEKDLLMPFVKKHIKKGLPISGPYPADSLFWRASQGEFDIVISLYHDQGLIPIKLFGFEEAVNVTLGLPFIRTSPDHGTAFEIAFQNKASIMSMVNAIKLALKITENNAKISK